MLNKKVRQHNIWNNGRPYIKKPATLTDVDLEGTIIHFLSSGPRTVNTEMTPAQLQAAIRENIEAMKQPRA